MSRVRTCAVTLFYYTIVSLVEQMSVARFLRNARMFTTAHATVAITIAHYTGNPLLGFVLGLLSHLVFDAIPHGDRNLFEAHKSADGTHMVVRRETFFWRIAIVEGLIAVAVCVVIWVSGLASFWMVWIPALGGVLPDLLLAATKQGWLPSRFSAWYQNFNMATHEFWYKHDLPSMRGMALQVSTFVIALGLLVWT